MAAKSPADHRADLRAILRTRPTGMTPVALAHLTGRSPESVYRTLEAMGDAYIADWRQICGNLQPVWRVVRVPKHCPRPA